MVGGKVPRQRIWETIRTLAKSEVALTTYTVSRRSQQDDEAVRDYLRSLEKAGITRRLKAFGRDALWELLIDEGVEAPQVNKKVKRQPADAVECIWRALRIVGELSVAAAVEQATVGGAAISEHSARIYLQALAHAGYVERKDRVPGKPGRFRLIPARNSGPLRPVYQRHKYEQVFDQNLGKVVWAKGQQTDPAELSGLRIENERLRELLREWIREGSTNPELVERTTAQVAQ
jgi:hypothetical protein